MNVWLCSDLILSNWCLAYQIFCSFIVTVVLSEVKSSRTRTRTQSTEQSESKEVQDEVDEVLNSDSKHGTEIEGSLEASDSQEIDPVGEDQDDTTISEDLTNEASLSKGDKKTSETGELHFVY